MKAKKSKFVMVAYFIIQITVLVSAIILFSCTASRKELIEQYGRKEIREERCNGKDENENGLIDEGCLLWYYEFQSRNWLYSPKICSNRTIVLFSCSPSYSNEYVSSVTVYGLRLDDGKIAWQYSIRVKDCFLPLSYDHPLEVSDLDGDGKDEVIISYGQEKVLDVISCDDGKLLWSFKEDGQKENHPFIFFNGPYVEDIDYDGKIEIVVKRANIIDGDKLYILSWNGQIKEVYSINLTNFIILPIFKPLGGDIDEDGKKEIILLGVFQKSTTNEITETLKDKIYVIDNNIVAIDISHITGDLSAPPVVEDINSDRKDEIIIPFLVEIYAIDGKGNVIWNFDKVGEGILSQPVISDIDSDGKPEILFISRDGKIKVLNGEGKLISEYEVWKRDEKVMLGASSLALVDIDFDGRKEIIGWTDEVFMIKNGVKVWNFIVGGPKKDFEPPLVVNDDGDFKIVVTFANRIYVLKAGKVKK